MCRSASDSEILSKLRSCEILFRSSNRPLTLLKVGVFETRNPAIFGLHGKGLKGRIRARKNAMCARGWRRVFILLLLARFFVQIASSRLSFLRAKRSEWKSKIMQINGKKEGRLGLPSSFLTASQSIFSRSSLDLL